MPWNAVTGDSAHVRSQTRSFRCGYFKPRPLLTKPLLWSTWHAPSAHTDSDNYKSRFTKHSCPHNSTLHEAELTVCETDRQKWFCTALSVWTTHLHHHHHPVCVCVCISVWMSMCVSVHVHMNAWSQNKKKFIKVCVNDEEMCIFEWTIPFTETDECCRSVPHGSCYLQM